MRIDYTGVTEMCATLFCQPGPAFACPALGPPVSFRPSPPRDRVFLCGQLGNEVEERYREDDGDEWDAVLAHGPATATPAAIPGMFANEEYTEAQRHALYVFRYLLVFVAALESFAHGANDTGNATGLLPLAPCTIECSAARRGEPCL
jgi:hypothetical protein